MLDAMIGDIDERRQGLLQQTLYYKGEEDYEESTLVTDGASSLYWDYERVWVRWEMEHDEEYLAIVAHFREHVLKDEAPYEGVPIGLQAIFASRIAHWSGGREPVTMKDVRAFCEKYRGQTSK